MIDGTIERGVSMGENTIYYISEAAKKVQVEAHVLRYWEEELQLAIRRNEMGHRCYTTEDIERLQQIKLLKEQGLQLKAIRSVLSGNGGIISGGNAMRLDNKGEGVSDIKETETVSCRQETEGGHGQLQMQNMEKKGKDTKKDEEDVEKIRNRGSAENMGDMEQKVEDMVMKKAQKYMVTLSKGKEPVIETPREELSEYSATEDMDKAQKAARLQYLLQHMVTEAVRTANQEMCTEIKESILKELDYQFRQQEERDEEHWKKEEEHYRKIDEMIRQRHLPKERLPKGKKKSPINL